MVHVVEAVQQDGMEYGGRWIRPPMAAAARLRARGREAGEKVAQPRCLLPAAQVRQQLVSQGRQEAARELLAERRGTCAMEPPGAPHTSRQSPEWRRLPRCMEWAAVPAQYVEGSKPPSPGAPCQGGVVPLPP